MTDTPTGGLRERKKRATQQAIERGAIELALEHGYRNVTVEMICERAMISPRTFFNYTGSKEHAILGIDPPLPNEEIRARYIAGAGSSPLEDLIATIIATLSDLRTNNPELFRQRRHIIHTNPELALKEITRIEETHHALIDLVTARLLADAPDTTDPDIHDQAEMIVAVAFGIMHYIIRQTTTRALIDPDELKHTAMRLARRATGM